MALYTRLWAAGKPSPPSLVYQQAGSLTIQTALELINSTPTPNNIEIKLAYSIWEKQIQSNTSAKRFPLSRSASA